jgi:hypothetical protein
MTAQIYHPSSSVLQISESAALVSSAECGARGKRQNPYDFGPRERKKSGVEQVTPRSNRV